MTWFAISGQNESWFSPVSKSGAHLFDTGKDALVLSGSILIETRFPVLQRPRPLLLYENDGEWPFHLSLQAVPGGSLTLIFDQNGDLVHHVFGGADAGRTDILRISYSWDAPAKSGRLVLERSDRDDVQIVPVTSPRPVRVKDIESIMKPGPSRYMAPELIFVAASDKTEPVGPMPSLWPDTPVATPDGFRHIQDLKRGDLVLTPDWRSVPVLHNISRTVPAQGSFAPVKIFAPYFGLRQDITTAPFQSLITMGSEVEYLFGKESVRFRAGHLTGGQSTTDISHPRVVTYHQLLLPENEILNVAGAMLESLWIGRLRRKPVPLAASILAKTDRNTLPEHAPSEIPALGAFEAAVLSEHRAA